MWYRLEGGVIVGGPFNCAQEFDAPFFKEDHPAAVAFNAARLSQISELEANPPKSIEQKLADLTAEIAVLKNRLSP